MGNEKSLQVGLPSKMPQCGALPAEGANVALVHSYTAKERELIRPRKRQSIADWARANLWLTTEMGASVAGPYDPDITPWVYEMFEAYCDRRVTEVVACMSAQIGKSLWEQVCIAYTIAHNPHNIAFFTD